MLKTTACANVVVYLKYAGPLAGPPFVHNSHYDVNEENFAVPHPSFLGRKTKEGIILSFEITQFGAVTILLLVMVAGELIAKITKGWVPSALAGLLTITCNSSSRTSDTHLYTVILTLVHINNSK